MTHAPENIPLALLAENLTVVSDIYAARFGIVRDECWYLAKLSEELGELTSVILRQTGRGRCKGADPADLSKQAKDELADLIAHCLLLAHARKLDVDAAIRRKWLVHLPSQQLSDG